MNRKDYKEIAGIVKNTTHRSDELYRTLSDDLIIELADYFEKTVSKEGIKKDVNVITKYYESMSKKQLVNYIVMLFNLNDFNRQQFIKDCGIK